MLLTGVHQGAGLLGVTAGIAVAGLGTGLTLKPLTQLALNHVPA